MKAGKWIAMYLTKNPMFFLLESEGKSVGERREVRDNQSLLVLFPRLVPYSTENIQINSPKSELPPEFASSKLVDLYCSAHKNLVSQCPDFQDSLIIFFSKPWLNHVFHKISSAPAWSLHPLYSRWGSLAFDFSLIFSMHMFCLLRMMWSF